MLSLKGYYHKKVRIVNNEGEEFEGIVDAYFHPEDNENNLESIAIDTEDRRLIEFYPYDINSITIIK